MLGKAMQLAYGSLVACTWTRMLITLSHKWMRLVPYEILFVEPGYLGGIGYVQDLQVVGWLSLIRHLWSMMTVGYLHLYMYMCIKRL